MLEAKYRLGLFKDPYRGVTEARAKATEMKPAYQEAARDITRRTLVLLKNEKQTLPLKNTVNVAVVGPLADRAQDMIGNWSAAGDGKQAVSILAGNQERGRAGRARDPRPGRERDRRRANDCAPQRPRRRAEY
ncbi:MAG: glycoside hydrolase family 3 C-terminal domain-containing protein [Hymenobacter sp.]